MHLCTLCALSCCSKALIQWLSKLTGTVLEGFALLLTVCVFMAISAPHFLERSRRRNVRRCRHIIVKYIFKLNLDIWKFEDISSCRPIAKSHYLKLTGISYSLNLTISRILEICIFFQGRLIWRLELFFKLWSIIWLLG